MEVQSPKAPRIADTRNAVLSHLGWSGSVWMLLSALALWFSITCGPLVGGEEPPKLRDANLTITLFAEEPDIVTPIGLAMDQSSDRLFVIESHTHLVSKDYDGPKSDRVKILEDRDGDGKADRIEVFADGIQQAMNLAFSPGGTLYVVCAREVLALIDQDQDGVCEQRRRILQLVTPERYAHNSLLGITFDREGWMYVARGNTGSNPYRLEGTDGTYVEGYGDGGSVIRCRSDGSEISEFATGFWNPFDLKFDAHGRLLLLDNDPDARGPNRLLQVVQGGDYGYRSIYGGAGTHPFQGWDGTLPGTLPYITGTGEAPSGVIDCRRTSFPLAYRDSVLATIWNENSIERYEVDAETGKLERKSVFLKGDQNFRPVAIDCDRNGNLFFTDWVLVDYPNHGRGKIWRIAAKHGAKRIDPRNTFDYQPNRLQQQIGRLEHANEGKLVELLGHDETDVFLRHAAIMQLAKRGSDTTLKRCVNGSEAHRLAALLAYQRRGTSRRSVVSPFLADPSETVRLAALQWAAQSRQLELADDLETAIRTPPVSPVLFQAFLAATEVLTPEFVDAYHTRSAGKANKIPRRLDPGLVQRLARDRTLTPAVRRLAIDHFDAEAAKRNQPYLVTLLNQHDLLAMAAMDALAKLPADDQPPARLLAAIAADVSRSVAVRVHALATLSENAGGHPETVVDLPISDPDDRVAVQAHRSLRTLQRKSIALSPDRPQNLQQWRAALASGGDPLLGRYVFRSARVGCSRCHGNGTHGSIQGDTLGPSLSRVASSKSRKQIIDAILEPSRDFPPQYQAWTVLTTDGNLYRGLQLDHKAQGAILLTLETGKDRRFNADEIEAYQATPNSFMPAGLSDTMTVAEFRDLVAYLSSLR